MDDEQQGHHRSDSAVRHSATSTEILSLPGPPRDSTLEEDTLQAGRDEGWSVRPSESASPQALQQPVIVPDQSASLAPDAPVILPDGPASSVTDLHVPAQHVTSTLIKHDSSSHPRAMSHKVGNTPFDPRDPEGSGYTYTGADLPQTHDSVRSIWLRQYAGRPAYNHYGCTVISNIAHGACVYTEMEWNKVNYASGVLCGHPPRYFRSRLRQPDDAEWDAILADAADGALLNPRDQEWRPTVLPRPSETLSEPPAEGLAGAPPPETHNALTAMSEQSPVERALVRSSPSSFVDRRVCAGLMSATSGPLDYSPLQPSFAKMVGRTPTSASRHSVSSMGSAAKFQGAEEISPLSEDAVPSGWVQMSNPRGSMETADSNEGEAIHVQETLFPSYLSNDQERLAVVPHGTQEDPFPFGHTTASSSVAERINAPGSGPSEQPRSESESAFPTIRTSSRLKDPDMPTRRRDPSAGSHASDGSSLSPIDCDVSLFVPPPYHSASIDCDQDLPGLPPMPLAIAATRKESPQAVTETGLLWGEIAAPVDPQEPNEILRQYGRPDSQITETAPRGSKDYWPGDSWQQYPGVQTSIEYNRYSESASSKIIPGYQVEVRTEHIQRSLNPFTGFQSRKSVYQTFEEGALPEIGTLAMQERTRARQLLGGLPTERLQAGTDVQGLDHADANEEERSKRKGKEKEGPKRSFFNRRK